MLSRSSSSPRVHAPATSPSSMSRSQEKVLKKRHRELSLQDRRHAAASPTVKIIQEVQELSSDIRDVPSRRTREKRFD
jgi:hypothetical protein